MIGQSQLIIIVVIALVLFGGSQIPKLARSLGQAQKEFKQGLAEASDDEQPTADQVKKET